MSEWKETGVANPCLTKEFLGILTRESNKGRWVEGFLLSPLFASINFAFNELLGIPDTQIFGSEFSTTSTLLTPLSIRGYKHIPELCQLCRHKKVSFFRKAFYNLNFLSFDCLKCKYCFSISLWIVCKTLRIIIPALAFFKTHF